MEARAAAEERGSTSLESRRAATSPPKRRKTWRWPRRRKPWRWQRRRQERRRGTLSMITHVILFKPRPELTADERQALLKSLEAAAAKIPSIGRIRLGARIQHGRPGYEQM